VQTLLSVGDLIYFAIPIGLIAMLIYIAWRITRNRRA
jgi:hypothetical protein